jgi:UDP-N-acetylglucosamine acyltransferase
MSRIHPTACVAPGAEIGADVTIGPYCVIGPNAVLADGCRLLAHVHVTGHTSIGARTVVYPFASLGTPPQSVKYRGGPTRLVIGADCDIREGVTMNIGTEDGGGVTTVSDHGFFMANAHVGHDCQVGSHASFANSATLGGHCIIGDHVVLGGFAALHQFTRVGDGAMLGGMSGLRSDLIPMGIASGNIARLVGINQVGMKRRGYSPTEIRAVKLLYQKMFLSPGLFRDRVEAAVAEFGNDPLAGTIIEFVQATAHRSLCQPGVRE